jgi:hypothetical protein
MTTQVKIGDVFGRLKVTGFVETPSRHRMIECLCRCGKLVRCRKHHLIQNGPRQKSCGCWRADIARARMTGGQEAVRRMLMGEDST